MRWGRVGGRLGGGDEAWNGDWGRWGFGVRGCEWLGGGVRVVGVAVACGVLVRACRWRNSEIGNRDEGFV